MPTNAGPFLKGQRWGREQCLLPVITKSGRHCSRAGLWRFYNSNKNASFFVEFFAPNVPHSAHTVHKIFDNILVSRKRYFPPHTSFSPPPIAWLLVQNRRLFFEKRSCNAYGVLFLTHLPTLVTRGCRLRECVRTRQTRPQPFPKNAPRRASSNS